MRFLADELLPLAAAGMNISADPRFQANGVRPFWMSVQVGAGIWMSKAAIGPSPISTWRLGFAPG